MKLQKPEVGPIGRSLWKIELDSILFSKNVLQLKPCKLTGVITNETLRGCVADWNK